MEEKKTVRINLSKFFLILAIIVIIILGYFIYKLYNDNKAANIKVIELNNQIIELESTVHDLQETINNISNLINGYNENIETELNSNDMTNTSTLQIFSNDEIKNALQNYLDLVGTQEGSPEELLIKLGLTSYGSNTEILDNGYIKTNIKYSEYKYKMLNYMTEQTFENHFTNYFKDINGYLYYLSGGATGTLTVVDSIEAKGDYSSSTYIADVHSVNDDGSKEQYSFEFHISNYNGNCVIDF